MTGACGGHSPGFESLGKENVRFQPSVLGFLGFICDGKKTVNMTHEPQEQASWGTRMGTLDYRGPLLLG